MARRKARKQRFTFALAAKLVRIPRRQAVGNDESFLSSRMAARLPQRGEILAFLWST